LQGVHVVAVFQFSKQAVWTEIGITFAFGVLIVSAIVIPFSDRNLDVGRGLVFDEYNTPVPTVK
jgi:hypothetical protein